MKVRLLVMIIVASFQASATTYYLSGKGNDLQSGTSVITPWSSLKKLSEAIQLVRPGDSILFERGSIFSGELKLSFSGKLGKEIYVGAYGSGARPIISGSVEVKNWTLLRDNIWIADCMDCTTEPANVFIDGQYQPLGRYPNEGYMTFSCDGQCTTTLTDNHHTFANDYWDKAEVVVKSSRWTLDNVPVIHYFNKTFYFPLATSYPLPKGYGYFIQKHLATLDKPGEWFYDKASKKIFLYYNNNSDNPNNHRVEASMIDLGLDMSNSDFVTIENIVLKYHRKSGVQIKYCNGITLRNCNVEYSGNNGMEINSCQNPVIESCRIENSNNNGVEWVDNTNGSFIKNFIHRTGLQPGRGHSGNGTYIGLRITANIHQATKNLFQFNSIDSTGYLGIDFRTGGNTIKNNLISNFCMIKDDGAGIYTWGNTYGDNKVEGNIVLHGVGNGSGTNDPDQSWANGIYIDDRSTDINIDNNTIAFCNTTGIYVHNAKRLSINGNTLFANGGVTNRENAQLCIKRDPLVPWVEGESFDLHISGNKFVTFQQDNHCLYLRAEKEQNLRGLEFDRNMYWAPYEGLVVSKLVDHQEMCNSMEELTLAEWSQTGCDKNSQFELIDAPKLSASPNLVRNGSMTNSTEGWMFWPEQLSIQQDKLTGVNAPSLKVLFPGGSEALLYYPGISLSSNKWYRLSFSAKSISKGKIEFVPLMASSPWEALDDYTCFSLDKDFKSFTYFFKPNQGNKNARLNFKSNASFWIDNVTLSEVDLDPGASAAPLQLFYNADEKSKTLSLTKEFVAYDGNQIDDKLVIQGFGSRIVRRNH